VLERETHPRRNSGKDPEGCRIRPKLRGLQPFEMFGMTFTDFLSLP